MSANGFLTGGSREPHGGHGAVPLCQHSSRTRAHAFEARIKEGKAAYLWFVCVQLLKERGKKKEPWWLLTLL